MCTWIDNTPSSLASGIKHLHALSLQLLALLHSLSAAAIQLPGLLQRAHANMLARLTALANNARSLSGTPACPSADCVRIAARSTELITSFRKVWEVAILVMGVVVVLVTAHYVEKYLAMILRGVIDSISTTYSGKWEPGARSPPSSPVRRSPPVTAAAQRPSLLLGGRPRVRLERLAEEASVLLEVFSKNVADGGGGAEALGDDQKTMIIKTLRNVLDIKKELKIVVPEMDEREDNKCVICYDNVADMVVLPCRHLAMCMTCCNGMGITESGISTYSTAKCPICRTVVTSRMKIFRS